MAQSQTQNDADECLHRLYAAGGQRFQRDDFGTRPVRSQVIRLDRQAHGIQDAAPPGLSSQPDHNFTLRANLNTVLLRVSQSPWFNLPLTSCTLRNMGTRQNLVAASNAYRLTSEPYGRVP